MHVIGKKAPNATALRSFSPLMNNQNSKSIDHEHHPVHQKGNARKKRVIVKFFMFLIILFFAIPSFFTTLLFENRPIVNHRRPVNPKEAIKARDLVKRCLNRITQSEKEALISASRDDLQSLMSLGLRGFENFSGDIQVTEGTLVTSLALKLPKNPVGDFINFRMDIKGSDSGINIYRVVIGRISMPGGFVLALARLFLDYFLGDGQGTAMIESVRSVTIDNNGVAILFRPVSNIKRGIRKVEARLKNIRDEVAPLGDPLIVRTYCHLITELSERDFPVSKVSFAHFIGPLFSLAKERSHLSDAVQENQAAILALAIYFGNSHFENLIGPVLTTEMRAHRRRLKNVVLAGRKDLRLHFVISAGLKIISDRGLTYAVGEFKELLDAAKGGSGFSFPDLAADLAGIRFSEVATDESGGARRLQIVLAGNLNEDAFFPETRGLPENIEEDEFERIYGGVEGKRYLEIVKKIEEQISRLPAYQVKRKTGLIPGLIDQICRVEKIRLPPPTLDVFHGPQILRSRLPESGLEVEQ